LAVQPADPGQPAAARNAATRPKKRAARRTAPARPPAARRPAPADPAAGARRRRARYDISPEQLWDLHHGQGLSFTEIGQRTGYSRSAIKDLARTYGIPMDTGHGLLNSGKET
jgi:hypothetical protein